MKHSLFFFALILSFCVMGAPQKGDAPDGWRVKLACRKQEGNLQFAVPWGGKTRPMVFMLRQKTSGRMIRIQMDAANFSADEMLPGGRYLELPPVSFYPMPVPEQPKEAEIVFKVREDEWSYYVDGVLTGTMAAPFDLPGDVLLPNRPGVKIVKDKMSFHPVAKAAFKTDFMIEPGAPNELYPWTIQLGKWHIHTAQAQAVIRPETDQVRAQQAPLTADKSPNFYSIKGGGENKDSVITMGYDFYDNYSLTGSLQLDNGEAGIVFLHRDEKVPPSPAGEEPRTPDPAKADFYAFTIRMEVPYSGNRDVRLWKQQNGVRTVLARASVPLYNAQWYLPGIKIHGDEIICLLDEAELFRVKEQLPVGGKIGLFANTKEEIRFDDITLFPYRAFDLAQMEDVRHNAIYSTDGFFTTKGHKARNDRQLGFRIYTVDSELEFNVNAGKRDEMLVLGRAFSNNMYFKAEVTPRSQETGVIAGWTGAGKPYYRFSVKRADGKDISTLAKIAADGSAETLDTYEVPSDGESVELGIDCTDPGKIRCFRNGYMLHYSDCGAPVRGGCGVWLAANGSASVKGMELSGIREVNLEQEQKNAVFKEDNFMRHWASPEGMWINGGNNILWHKGDFFGDFSIRLPVVPTAELHVGVPDGKEQGTLVVNVAADKISLTVNVPGAEAPIVQEVPLAPIGDKAVTAQSYELRREGSWLWLLVEGNPVISQRLTFNLKELGTRVLSRNMTLAHMAKSKVTRTNILDEYFYESPHAWLANGGDWQIINRFQCTPSWSHMIGEAPVGLGAFWLKKLFKGDMVLEFYAGTRHNYYDYAGNLNCTIMAHDTTPSQGYTVACTEWDHNDSQNWTTFYRNGKALDKTDAYLVPRKRKGMYRKILNPLVSQGRPIHGAWFYIKLRKIGDKLEYYFDDELLFTQKDGEMMNDGLVGIWTFIHSMTLAQIKITFDDIKPKPIPVTLLSTEDVEPAKPQVIAWSAKANGFPIDAADAKYWSYSDNVNQGTMLTAPGAVGIRSALGGGEMKLTANLPVEKLSEIAGWRFKLKRTARANFNFFFSIGELADDGSFKGRVRNCFHHISGTTFSEGGWRMTGSSDVKSVDKLDIASADGWEDVTVWIPAGPMRGNARAAVKIGGFGIEQRDEQSNGIWGNGPGEGYAIRDLRPIFIGAPAISMDAESQCAVGDEFVADASGLQPILAAAGDKTVVDSAIRERRGNDVRNGIVSWMKLPEKPVYSIKWSAENADVLRIEVPADYADPRMETAQITFAGKPLRVESTIREASAGSTEKSQSWGMTLHLPRTPELQTQFATGKLELAVNVGGVAETVALDVNAAERVNGAPVLMGIEGLTPFCLPFEDGLRAPLNDKPNRRTRLYRDDPQQGNYLSVWNNNKGERLKHSYAIPFSVSNYPVAQFRYRAYDMDYVTMLFGNGQAAHLTPGDLGRSVGVRLGTELKRDEKWNTWTGVISDSFNFSDFNVNRFRPGAVTIGSASESYDQTGDHSRLDLDDFTFGPSVKDAAELAFVPTYYDADGVASVRVAILKGDLSAYDTAAEALAALPWKEYKPGEKIVPAFPEGMPSGVSHVVMAATDAKGRQSSYFDVPFFFDNAPMTVAASIGATASPKHNGTQMAVVFNNGGGSPWAIEAAKFFINGKESAIMGWTNQFVHATGSDAMYLNYPLIYRDLLDDAKDGDEMTFEIDNIKDGAGNPLPRFKYAFKVNYAEDKEGPAWFDTKFGSSVNYNFNWDGYRQDQQFTQGSYNPIAVDHNKGASPYLRTHSYYGTGDLNRALAWKVARHPCISFRAMTTTSRPSMTIHLVLTATSGKVYSISLINPGSAPSELNRKEAFTWKNGQWMHFSFNVRELMQQAGVPQAEIDAMEIKNLNFQRRGVAHNDSLMLDDFFIHGMPEAGKPDILEWHAFDISGVASLKVTAVSVQEAGDKLPVKDEWTHSFTAKHSADLNELRAKFKGICWFRCEAIDKTGKASVPFWMPVYSE